MAGSREKRRPSSRRRTSAKPAVWGSWWAWAALAVLAAVIVAGIAAGGGSGTGTGDQAAETARRDLDAVEAGRRLFEGICAACHGIDLNGTDFGPPFLSPIYAPNHHADEAFQRAVLVGVQPHHWDFGPMPPVAGLTRDDVEDIVVYVRSRQEAAGIFTDPSHP